MVCILKLFINRNGTLYNEANQTDTYAADAVTTQVADSPAGVGRFYVTYTNGLYNAASGTATNIEYADEDILTGGESPASSTICEFEGRIWLNLGSRLRGSDLTDPSLEET